MTRRDVEDVYRLSPAQQGILFHCLYAPEAGLYIDQLSCTLDGRCDPAALRQAWERVVQRHPMLRTSFHHRNLANPVQLVRRRVALPWTEQDWRGLSPLGQRQRLDAYLEQDRLAGFDLGRAPLLRLFTARVGEDRHLLVWTFHHLLLDGWSVALVLREVATLYEAVQQGQQVDLGPARPYRDYIAWLQRQPLDRAERFWRAYLRGVGGPTPLPVEERPPRREEPPLHLREDAVLSAPATADLERLARRQGLTLNTLVQAAWALLLGRYSGEPEVVFGTVTSGRPPELPGVDAIVGMFINTLPTRVRVPPREPLARWLQRLQQQQAQLREYEFTPLPEIQRWSGIPRGTPLFESVVVFENYPLSPVLHQAAARLGVRDLRGLERSSHLSLHASPADRPQEGLSLTLTADGEKLTAATLHAMTGHLTRLLRGMAEDPWRPPSALPLLGEEERHELLVSWNATAASFPEDRCLHELVEQQAADTPEAVAVVEGEGRRLNYRELEARGNRLAHHLRGLGVGPEVVVGVHAERSLELVVGLLGVLKAGGAYLPLDPAGPARRLAFMLGDARSPVVLTQARLADRLPGHDAAVVRLDADWRGIGARPATRPAGSAGPGNAAYVIYTSGSTGVPKGVVIQHRGIVNRLLWMQDAYRLGRDERVLQKTPFDFDVSVWELFWPLLTGARLVLARPGGHRDPAYLVDTINRHQVTTVHFVPAMLRASLDAGRLETCRSLRRVICSGEALPVELHDRFLEQLPGVELHNLYGPTEASVDVTAWACRAGGAGRTVPIGRPVANTQVYVLDPQLEPVPVGVAGELCIGGVQVARGYLNRPGLTAERFVPNPFGPGRLYRTGDVARWRRDGTLEFLGRQDDQVKIRGFRVELGELEAVLVRHPGVRQAVAVAREQAPGERELVAYVVPSGDEAPAQDELRRFLLARLPDYMVPTRFVRLQAVPLTPSGKVDRKALPPPGGAVPGPERPYAAPRDDAERTVADIWGRLLGVDRVGVHDDFFDLGGHSLLAIQVVSRLRQELGVELPLRTVFQARTVAQLAAALQALGEQDHALEPAAPDGEPPLSLAQQRIWFLARLTPGDPLHNLATAWRLRGELDVAAVERALGDVIARHEVLRTGFPAVDGHPVQRVARSVTVRLPFVDLTHLPPTEAEAETRRLAAAESVRPFDLGVAPLLRAALLRLDTADHVLLLTLHRLVADEWSVGVLLRELTALYRASTGGAPSPLRPLPLQYSDFAAWQRRRLDGPRLARHLKYWRRQLAGAPEALGLPTDRPRPPLPSHRAAARSVRLPPGPTAALRALSRQERTTLFTTLLAAFQAFLGRHTHATDVVVAVPVAGRTRAELEGLIGCFADLLVLRGDLAGDPTFRELLGRVRPTAVGAFNHQELPFQLLVEELQPARDPARHPLAQVACQLVDLHGAEAQPLGVLRRLEAVGPEGRREPLGLSPPGLSVEPADGGVASTPFDLELQFLVRQGELTGRLVGRADLFDEATIESLLARLVTLLEGIAAAPDRRLSRLPLLPERERRELAAAGEGGRHQHPPACLHRLVEEQARQTPAAVAVADAEGRQLSYGELDLRANRLAHRLRRLDVRPETVVGVCLERRVDLAVALLGVLKAGGACLPLDPGDRPERQQLLLADADATVLLTQAGPAARLPACRLPVVVVDDGHEGPAVPATPLRETAQQDNLAYVLYGPDAAGAPAGVLLTHRALGNHLAWARRAFPLSGEDRVLQRAPLGDQAALWELWAPLSSGARLVLARPGVLTSAGELVEAIVGQRITVLQLAPWQLRPLLEEPRLGECSTLRLVRCQGETLPAELAGRLRQRLAVSLHNLYGPAEAGGAATVHAPPPAGAGAVPIGRPVDNLRVRVLDDRLEPVPIGVTGELCIAGEPLARGYVGRPGLTAERFVPDPFGPPGSRLFRSGEPARWLPGGVLQPGGRPDPQAGSGRGRPTSKAPATAPRTAVEEALAGIWRELLGVERVGVHDDFFALGGHSLLLPRLVVRIGQVLGVEVPLALPFRAPTLAELAEAVEDVVAGAPGPAALAVPDLDAEAALEPDLRPRGPARAVAGRRALLLTGATGFIGAFLLQGLLERTEATIYCLVRAADEQQAADRLRQRLQAYGAYHPGPFARAVAVPGDLTLPLLGLGPERFEAIAAEVDAVYHSGAQVNFLLPYQALKPENVDGTREVIRLACHGAAKHLHHVSTVGVAGPAEPSTVVRESDPLDRYRGALVGGYNQSKWVAERMVTIAASRGLPVTVYRPGYVTGHSQTGAWNRHDFGWRLVQACIRSGIAPEVDWVVAMTPVDFVSRAIAYLSERDDSAGKVFHLVSSEGAGLDEIVAWASAAGYPLRRVPYRAWLEEMTGAARRDRAHPLRPLLPLLDMELKDPSLARAGSRVVFDCANTRRALAGGPVSCPPTDRALFDTYLAYLVRTGLVDAPPTAGAAAAPYQAVSPVSGQRP